MAVVIETTLGDITIDLFVNERPTTCMNFLKLCKIKYYNFCLFHSVQQNFIAQSGDPSGTGHEGNSIFFHTQGKDAKYYEAEKLPKLKHTNVGTVSMVNCGNQMLGSQFFITLGKDLQSLDGEHCVFGEVVEGHDILRKFNEVISDQEYRPYQDIRITHTVILDDPFDDPLGLQIPDCSPTLTKEALANSRIAPDEEIDETAGLTLDEVEELHKSREAKAQATILEIVGDLPDAEVAPPENVLFVCKLNPVTTDDDLEIIFSRFGKVVSCEVIRDKTTGDSLQYAFVEFENRKACEDAYFKMDNVLIDDRRIHVDFSQSVSKLRWKGKGRGVEHIEDGKPKPDYANYSRKSSSNVSRHSPNISRRRYTEENNSPRHKESISSRKENDERRSRNQMLRNRSPHSSASKERSLQNSSYERYEQSHDYNDYYSKQKSQGSRYTSSREQSICEGHKKKSSQSNREKDKKRRTEKNFHEKEINRKRRTSDSDSDYYKENPHREKYGHHKERKDYSDSETKMKKSKDRKCRKREVRSTSSDSDTSVHKDSKYEKGNLKKSKNNNVESDNKCTSERNKHQKYKESKNEKQKTRKYETDSENDGSCRQKSEKSKNSINGSSSDEEKVLHHKEGKKKKKKVAGVSKLKVVNSEDVKVKKRRDNHSDSDHRASRRSDENRSSSKRKSCSSHNRKEALQKKAKISKKKGIKYKYEKKNKNNLKNKKLIQKNEKKKKKQSVKKQDTSSSSETSESSSDSDSDVDSSSSETSSSSSNSSNSSGSGSSSDSSCSSSSTSGSSSYSSSTSSSSDRYDHKHKRRKKLVGSSDVKRMRTTVLAKSSKRDLRRPSDSSTEECRKIKVKNQKRKNICSKNGLETDKNLKLKSRSKKRRRSSSADRNSDSSCSSEKNAKGKKHQRKAPKK